MPAPPSPHPRDPHRPRTRTPMPRTRTLARAPRSRPPRPPRLPLAAARPAGAPAPPGAPARPAGPPQRPARLRRAYRRQRRTATLTALGYFVLFLTLSAFAPSFMTGTVTGVPAGLLLAVGQVPVTWLAVALYETTARRRLDPLAALIRRQADVDARREAVR